MIEHLILLTVTTTSSGAGWAWVAPVVGLLVGSLLIIGSILDGRKAKASLQWPSVPGVVLSSELRVDRGSGNDPTTFTPVVTYSYVVNGQPLQCAKVRYSSTTSKKVLAKYPKGCPVQVFYNPQSPSTAVLERGGSTGLMMFAGVAVLVGGCLVGFVMK